MRAIILVLLLTGCASVPSPTPEQAALADITTTAVALAHGAHELNPLGFPGTTIVKGMYFAIRDDFALEKRAQVDRTVSSIWSGAAVNNIIQLLWAPPLFFSLVPGVFIGYWIYSR